MCLIVFIILCVCVFGDMVKLVRQQAISAASRKSN